MEIMSWSKARKLGLSKYFTGKPCSRGHVSERFACNGVCIKCHKIISNKNSKKYYERPEAKYNQQRLQAKQRNIEWLFTLESWLEFWGEKLEFRGIRHNDLCCGRHEDIGPYSPENCYITTNEENLNHYRTGNYPRKDYGKSENYMDVGRI